MAVAGREIPNTNLKKHDGVRHPESLINHDRGYLVPCVGRGIKPKCKGWFNPFAYNPVIGGNDGGIIGGHRVPRFGSFGGGSYVPVVMTRLFQTLVLRSRILEVASPLRDRLIIEGVLGFSL
ncbi:hypothetical protein L1987_06171 [Smallanthus sonchifolius]|uniref:Uncharacterized protein n=1 Tax=Smallanthus sonchifolius TaxID=185202 RepID=A0ACB9JXJ0_9ASTR|nr:hypothetical protein L1987_06171 [Smallanthus sonchifolius]